MRSSLPFSVKVAIFVAIGIIAALLGLLLGAVLAADRPVKPVTQVTPSPMWHPPADWKGVQG